MTMWPLPENTKLDFEEFCKGCKHCEVDVNKYDFDQYVLSCSHMDACKSLYDRMLVIVRRNNGQPD